jgi:uncharacterized phage protein (TIGR02218 family)
MKSIPAALLTHKAQQTTTLCRLLKLTYKNGTVRGFANLDEDVPYDDGDGVLIYRSAQGFTPSRFASSAGSGVDNADLVGLIADLASLGVTEHEVRNGILDYAAAVCYEINYEDLTAGRHEIIATGNAGQAAMRGEQFAVEFRSLSQRFKQNTTKRTSLTCRVAYGSTQCGATLAWVSANVSAVDGTEPDRIFTCSSLAQATDYFVPGVVEVVNGENEGAQMEVVAFVSGGVITLARPLYWPMAVNDDIRIRIDCPKTPDGCRDSRRNRWPNDFRGEHLIPIGREEELLTPGASK